MSTATNYRARRFPRQWRSKTMSDQKRFSIMEDNAKLEVLTPDSPRWGRFTANLDKMLHAAGCAGERDGGARAYQCTKAVMNVMGGIDVKKSLAFFQDHGGFCDCEILMNVDRLRAGEGDKTMTEKTADKTDMSPEMADDHMTVEQWLAIRKEAGLHIDPETAEVEWTYAYTLDPYGVHPDLPEEYQQVGRAYFARSPGSDVWVCFYDLPAATRDALWEKHKSKLAFPAGLPLDLLIPDAEP